MLAVLRLACACAAPASQTYAQLCCTRPRLLLDAVMQRCSKAQACCTRGRSSAGAGHKAAGAAAAARSQRRGGSARHCARRAAHGLSTAPLRARAGEPGRIGGASAQAPPAGRGGRAAAAAGARRRAGGRAGPAERGGRVQLLPQRGRAVPVALRRVPGGPAAPAGRCACGAPPARRAQTCPSQTRP